MAFMAGQQPLSSFQRSIRNRRVKKGGDSCCCQAVSARSLNNLLCLTATEPCHTCQDLRSNQEWYALTQSGTLGCQTKALLLRTGSAITALKQQRSTVDGAGQTGLSMPSLIGPGGPVVAGSVEAQWQAAQRELLWRIHLSADGVTLIDLSCPSAR